MLPLFINKSQIDSLTITTNNPLKQSTKTYRYDFDTGEIYAEFIDYEDAIRQAVIKAIKTTRDRYLIYSSDYGCEIQYLMGKSYSEAYLKIEVPRLIKEALITDDRIDSCENFVVTKSGDTIEVSFTVITDLQSAVRVEVSI